MFIVLAQIKSTCLSYPILNWKSRAKSLGTCEKSGRTWDDYKLCGEPVKHWQAGRWRYLERNCHSWLSIALILTKASLEKWHLFNLYFQATDIHWGKSGSKPGGSNLVWRAWRNATYNLSQLVLLSYFCSTKKTMEGTTHCGLDPTYKLLIKINLHSLKEKTCFFFFILGFLFSDYCILCQLNKKLTDTGVEYLKR